MKNKLSSLILAMFIIFFMSMEDVYSQVGIDNPTPNPNATLDLGTTSKGFLINRISTAERTNTLEPNLGSGEKGLLVFDTDMSQLFFWDGAQWKPLSAGAITGGGSDGNIAFWTAGNALSDNPNLFWDDFSERLGIGTNLPNAALTIGGIPDIALEIKNGNTSGLNGYLMNIERTVEPTATSNMLQIKSPGSGATDNFYFMKCLYGNSVMANINGNGHLNATSIGAGTDNVNARITVDDNLWDVLLDVRQNNNPSVVDYMVNFEKTVVPYSGIDILRLAVPNGSPADAQFMECEVGGTEVLKINTNGDLKLMNGADIQVDNGAGILLSGGALQVEDGNNYMVSRLGRNTGGGQLNLRNYLNNEVAYLFAGQGYGGELSLSTGAGDEKIRLLADENDGAKLIMRNAAGSDRIVIDADFGTRGKIVCDEVQLLGGSDFAEYFDVHDKALPEERVEAGTVVCIDPANPGKLIPSDRAFDKKVAGIISGAGGIAPGLVMESENTIASGDYPVALSGRVYVKAVNIAGNIEPGDFLTTSSLPGHAMKVKDFDKARGAIIGKAMTSLDKKEGMVLVLVSLQ